MYYSISLSVSLSLNSPSSIRWSYRILSYHSTYAHSLLFLCCSPSSSVLSVACWGSFQMSQRVTSCAAVNRSTIYNYWVTSQATREPALNYKDQCKAINECGLELMNFGVLAGFIILKQPQVSCDCEDCLCQGQYSSHPKNWICKRNSLQVNPFTASIILSESSTKWNSEFLVMDCV